MNHQGLVSEIVAERMTKQFMDAFGWQGGTVHQVADELIRRGLDVLPCCQALIVVQDQKEKAMRARPINERRDWRT